MIDSFTIALAGNPNCGKTTLFNALTGSHQRVGNWPGVTVERMEGSFARAGADFRVVDLPGIYSFSAYSTDEKVSREFILRDKPDLVINIVDATNLERNLYLTTQLIELRAPVVVALNMMDVARHRGIRIDTDHLQRHLGCPVVPIVASRREGLEELKTAVLEAARRRAVSATHVEYHPEVEEWLARLQGEAAQTAEREAVDSRWLAIKLLEDDPLAREITRNAFAETVRKASDRVRRHVGDDVDVVVADGRYGFIHGLARDVIARTSEVRRNVSDMIDRVALNRALGIPIFLLVMYAVFLLTLRVGGGFIDFFDLLFGALFVDGLGAGLEAIGVRGWAVSLLAGGVGGGLQTVATFIPPIFFIFLCLSLLEDSGYMARAAFVMDRLLRAIGLPGKAFLPMLVGFGCNVPGIMAARTLENERDRTMTVLMNPLMSCGARLPIYVLFAAAFFPRSGSALIFGIYLAGIVLSVLTGLLLRSTLLRGEAATFVMELPPYHVPTVSGVLFHTWNKLKGFILRAGRVIVPVVIVLSFLNALGTDGSYGHENRETSVLSAVGKTLTPVFAPMGITEDNWPATVGLFTGIFAKEAVVGTLDSLYSQLDAAESDSPDDEEPFQFWPAITAAFASIPAAFEGFWENLFDPLGLRIASDLEDAESAAEAVAASVGTVHALPRYFGNRSAAVAYLLFILIYAPCVAALAALYRETKLRWMLFAVGYLTGLAWIVATLYYQIATFSLHPAASAAWIAGIGIALVLFVAGLRLAGRRLAAPEKS